MMFIISKFIREIEQLFHASLLFDNIRILIIFAANIT